MPIPHSYIYIILQLLAFYRVSTQDPTLIELANYDYPLPSNSARYETIAIVGTNDIHGRVVPATESYAGTNKSAKASGLTLLSSYLEILSQQWGNRLLWLDAGDEFQGSLESNLFKGKPLVDFFNYKNKIQKAAAIGNHEFDFGINELETRMRESRFQRFAANIFDRSTQRVHNFPNSGTSGIYKVGRIKVGVIGLSTIQTPYTTSTNLTSLEFKNYTDIVIQESKKLRRFNADVVILVAHIGNPCFSGNLTDLIDLKLRNSTTQQSTTCDPNEEIAALLNSIPEGTLDAVVGGHWHTISHHWINGVPLIMAENFARHLNVLYLKFDIVKRKLIVEDTVIEGPIPICNLIPQNERTCYSKNLKTKVTETTNLLNVSFHGKIINEDQVARDVLKKYIDEAKKYSDTVYGTIKNPMFINYNGESGTGNLLTDIIKWETKSDFAIYNMGGIRTNWETKGDLTYSMIFQTFPFDSFIYKFETLGKEVIEIMNIAQGGQKGFYQTSGFKQKVCLKPNHKLISVKLYNGEEIDPEKTYTISTNDFLMNGGDDFAKVRKIYKPRNPIAFDEVKEIVKKYLTQNPVINSDEKPCIDPNNKRLEVIEQC